MSFKSLIVKALEDPGYVLTRTHRCFSSYIEDTVRLMVQPQPVSGVVNQKEIMVVGLKRTGNHAIIRWLEKQHRGVVIHLNDIRVNRNPYRCIYNSLQNDHPRNEWLGRQIRRYPQYQGQEGINRLHRESLGYFDQKDCLIYSYEDYDLDQVTAPIVQKKHNLYFGESGQKYQVLILRDPFNLLASRIKKNYRTVKSWKKTVIDMWINYAKEYLGETQYLQDNKIVINYNQWVSNVEYRKELATQLNVDFSDSGINEVTSFGGGSSFDGTQFRGNASNMNVFGRWKEFAGNRTYRALLNNEELLHYSTRIFGHIPGTELLRMNLTEIPSNISLLG